MSTERTKLVDDINHSNSFKRERALAGAAPSNSKRKWYIIGGVITAAVVVGIILGVTLSRKKDSSDPSTPKGYYNPYSAPASSVNF